MKEQYDFNDAKRGAVISNPNKQRITIRLDSDVVNWFKEQVQGGGNYQSLINEALRSHIKGLDERVANTIRNVIKEEIKALKHA